MLSDGESETLLLESATVEIHRSDRDSNVSGWRAIIRAVSDKKVRAELSPEISPAVLYPQIEVTGDVLVVQERNNDGDLVPKTYHLLSVSED